MSSALSTIVRGPLLTTSTNFVWFKTTPKKVHNSEVKNNSMLCLVPCSQVQCSTKELSAEPTDPPCLRSAICIVCLRPCAQGRQTQLFSFLLHSRVLCLTCLLLLPHKLQVPFNSGRGSPSLPSTPCLRPSVFSFPSLVTWTHLFNTHTHILTTERAERLV
ncbi:hypothetical protein PoB_004547900 [Plakobranchus ocellatus]|uniref:Uncharacterized protein n=1 Tax=Plakobranchus ocellatus TaxID=259542 RepID=A0AAV4BKY2_9GAST|nr:hypothetical protein PoB_004547900 [Plakobranchus ocellatus]